MRPTAESRSCRSQASWIGVCPEGAQVHRRTGWSMKPLSSKKTMGLPRRFAPFLSAANPASATAPPRPGPVRAPVVRASGRSSPGDGGSSPRDRGDTRRETSWPPLRPPGGRSKARSGTPPSAGRPRESLAVAASASGSDGAWGRDGVWLGKPPDLLSARPDAIVSPKTGKQQRFPRPRRHRPLPGGASLRGVGGPPIRLRFLSVSYHTVRMFT